VLGVQARLGVGTALETGWLHLELLFCLLAEGFGFGFGVGEADEAPRLGIQVGGLLEGQPGAFRNEQSGAQFAHSVQAAGAVTAFGDTAKDKLGGSSAHCWLPPVCWLAVWGAAGSAGARAGASAVTRLFAVPWAEPVLFMARERVSGAARLVRAPKRARKRAEAVVGCCASGGSRGRGFARDMGVPVATLSRGLLSPVAIGGWGLPARRGIVRGPRHAVRR